MKNEKIIFNKKLITNSTQVAIAWDQLKANRQIFNNAQEKLLEQHSGAIQTNQAAVLTQDYWREVDNITTRVIRDDEGAPLLDDLLSLGSPISIGKTAALYRVLLSQSVKLRRYIVYQAMLVMLIVQCQVKSQKH